MFVPLREPMFRRLVLGRVTTYTANAVAPVALAFAVLDLTGSVAMLGLVVGARSITNVALLLLGGVLADRLPRGVILQGASLAAAASQAAAAAAVLLGFASVPLLIVLSVVNGAVSAASLPAASALTPQTVPPSLLRQANALARVGTNTAMIAGASLGGMLAALRGPGWAMVGTAVVFLLAAFFYARVDAPEIAASEPTRPLKDLRVGWSEFASRTWLWSVVVAFMVVNAAVVGGIQVLGPSIADATFGRLAWGFILGAQTIGALVGGVVASRWQPRRALLYGTALVGVEAVPLLVLAHAPEVVLLLVIMFLGGMAIEQFGIAWDVSLQENIPQDRLARVYSYDAVGSFVAIPIGEIAVGPLANHFGTAATLTALAILVVVATTGASATPSIRALRRLDQPVTA
ncbi:MFS transporter [Actinokineospora auranticolor]|uniref:Putative MFS family arabinose efflux permease n=1 Tax=Actinokineospora auranticolor TaxID=155976 RepID=A0A2S6GBD9_9PSEU|nr:MFS transporter [Actinokineospora auranticolor]PPK61216.1 putative MFS family arabinose efflux permease [Actinokineospora auranticolor]